MGARDAYLRGLVALALHVCLPPWAAANAPSTEPRLTAEQWAAAMADCTRIVRDSFDPDAVYSAWRRGTKLDPQNVELHTHFIGRMLSWGMLHIAYKPAEALLAGGGVGADNPTAQAVACHMYATRGQMEDALRAAIAVIKARPQDPSALHNLGQLMAWYDLDPGGPRIDDSIKRDIDAFIRPNRLRDRDLIYRQAYGRGRSVYQKQSDLHSSFDRKILRAEQDVTDISRQIANLRPTAKPADRHRMLDELDSRRQELQTLRNAKTAAMSDTEAQWRWDPPTIEGRTMKVVAELKNSRLIPPLGAEEQAGKKLKLARVYIESKVYDKAEELLKEIIDSYAPTDAAGEATELLGRIPPRK